MLVRLSFLSVVVALFGCQNGADVVIPLNQAPVVQILEPEVPVGLDSVPVDGTLGVQARAVVDDAEDLPTELTVRWEAWPTDTTGDSVLLGEGAPDADGFATQVVGGLHDGAWRLVARTTDTDGASGEAAVSILILGADTPPEVVITQPGDGGEGLEGETLTLSAVASDDRGAEQLSAEWTSDLDGLLDASPPSTTGLLAFTTDELAVGDHTITVRVEDKSGQVGTAAVTYTILPRDLPPTAPYVDVQPDVATTVDDLDCVVLIAASDPEGDPLTYHFAWLRDGLPTLWDAPTLPAADTSAGETWRCEVVADDGIQQGAVGGDEVFIENTPPSVAHAEVGPLPAMETSVLSCVGIGWNDPDLDAEAYAVAWTVDGQPAGSTSTLDGSSFSRGQLVGCTLTAWDGTEYGASATAPTVQVQNSPPSVPGIVLTPSPVASLDDGLSCQWTAPSVDADGDPVSYDVQWLIDGVPAAAWSGTTTIPPLEGQLGEAWTCTIRGNDGLDPGPWATAATTFLPEPGDLVVTEIHLDPVAVADAAGEWIEVWNASDHPIDLLGFELHDDGTDSFVFSASVQVPAQGRVVLARNLDVGSNGGIVAAAELSSFSLDLQDEVVLSFFGTEIDRVDLDSSVVPAWLPGHSLSLDPASGDPDASTNDAMNQWCRSSMPIAGLDGDFGTPGTGNDSCPCGQSDGDGDGWGDDLGCPQLDCDDLDPGLSPEEEDVCEDGIDQDCSGADISCVCGDTDDDGDGFGDGLACSPLDCDDTNSTVNPAATEVCDGDDEDCDALIDEGWDGDNDGYTSCAGDCADADAARNPSVSELCNGIDDDCNSVLDDGFDLDGDGFTTCAGDCDDSQISVHLGATELCDGIDSDCDGSLVDAFPNWDNDGEPDCADLDDDNDGDADSGDCVDDDPSIFTDAPEACDSVDSDCDTSLVDGFADTDGDGTPDCVESDDDNDGDPDTSDCDDTNPNIYNGAAEACDLIDSDCDGSLVDGAPDWDGDGEPDCADTNDDNDPELDSSDCNDNNPGIYTGAPESCDSIDSNCNGSLVDSFANWDGDIEPDCVDTNDDNDPDPDTSDCNDNNTAIYTGATEACDAIDSDCDGSLVDGAPNWDGDGEPDCFDTNDDNDPELDSSDCNDNNPAIYTGAPESCDSIDSNCNGSLVDSFANWDGDAEPDCVDTNDDNDPDPDTTDCNDNNSAIYTGATEACDAIDSDCDGSLVDSFANWDGDVEPDCVDTNDDNDPDPDSTDCNDSNTAIYTGASESCDSTDSDCDGSLVDSFPNWDGDSEPDCVDANDDNDASPDSTDCNDNDNAVYVGASEACDSIDSDCDGSLIDGFSNYDGDTTPDCADPDDDNDGDPDSSDCNDNNSAIRTGASESCDSTDSDCDGSLIDGFANWDGDASPDCVDLDDDNDGDPDSADCSDFNSAVSHLAAETCNNIDDDCDTTIDDGFDADNDTWATCENDCNDNNSAIHPNQTDTCNGTDTDCDGAIDEDAASDGYEPNNSLGQAYYIGGDDSTATLNATFEYSDDNADWYSINTTDDTNVVCDSFGISVTMNSIPVGTDYDVYLWRNASTLLAYSEAFGNASESISWSAGCSSWGDDGGTYYVQVTRWLGWSCSDTYHLEVSNSN